MSEAKEEILVRPGFVIPQSELVFSYIASSGPGGQNVNKTATKTRLKWWPSNSAAVNRQLSEPDRERLFRFAAQVLAEDGSIQVVSDRFRNQSANQKECCRRLAEKLRTWLKRPKKRIHTKPTRGSKERRLSEKKRVGRIKKDRRSPSEE
ncbi:MAG: alternative ribosome rescue aminoacyl-tRNA hydrolase ArfB [Planctomycetota bacterium]